jgi:ribosome-associated heat shock protein Hsp15
VRLSRAGQLTRLDKASRSVRPGDELIFVLSERVFSLRIEALGDRRGPAPEARSLYSDAPSQAQA